MIEMYLKFEWLILVKIALVICEEVEILSIFGRIKGLRTAVNGGNSIVYQFRKIPYAVPPVGSLRFQKPLPHGQLTDVYDATEYGPSCMQTLTPENKLFNIPNMNVSEDCLHLNIYVPNHIGLNPRAVMVWIHGGGFGIGQGTLYDGSILASTGNVIVVTINYRLGLLGFIGTEDHNYPGNNGLFDQLEAIRWTKKYIGSFGGDPNRITIFGESAGAFSVAFLAASPLGKGLFHRVIMESGGDFQERVVYRDIRRSSLWAMHQLGCINDTSNTSQITTETIQCMVDVDAHQVVKVTDVMFSSPNELIPAYKDAPGPTVDGELIPDTVAKLLLNTSSPSSEVFDSVDMLIGYNSGDGSSIVSILKNLEKLYNFSVEHGVPNDAFCKALVPSITKQFFKDNMRVAEVMCGAYTYPGDKVEQARFVVNWFGDVIFSYPMQQIINFHTRSSKSTYQYLFSKSPSYRWNHIPSWFRGAMHAEELPCVFGLRDFVSRFTPNEEQLSKMMMKYWTNFAKTGDPNAGGSGNPIWPPYKARRAYLELNDKITVHHDLYAKRLTLWLQSIPHILDGQSQPNQPFG